MRKIERTGQFRRDYKREARMCQTLCPGDWGNWQALAHLLAEDRRPPASLWSETLVASRLLEYEIRTRLHARDLRG